MALVSYSYGSDSESDENEEPIENSKKNENIEEEQHLIREANGTPINIFTTLPKVKSLHNEMIEDKVEDFIPKAQIVIKERPKVKINIPSLSDFKDVGIDMPEKKPKPQSKSSGLLALLPPVKSIPITNKSFIPNVISKKNKSVMKKTNLVPHAVPKQIVSVKIIEPVVTKKLHNSDIESDDDTEPSESFDEEMWQNLCGRRKKKEPMKNINTTVEVIQPELNLAPDPIEPYGGLDNAAFKELVGKNKRIPGNIKLIDLNESEIMPDRDVWMTKSLTDPECAPKRSVENPVDPTRKRKHHITYLAQQAKANEQDLKNQWSANKYSRNQTRAKYGF